VIEEAKDTPVCHVVLVEGRRLGELSRDELEAAFIRLYDEFLLERAHVIKLTRDFR
jgi:hypothetical protein